MFFGGHAIAGLTSQEKLQTNRWLLQSWHPSYQDDFTSGLWNPFEHMVHTQIHTRKHTNMHLDC
jgi:hypothetical protein